VLSPVALFALVIALRYASTAVPLVSADDFHFGERLLGWWRTLRFHAIPFVDYVSVHGVLEDDLAGYVSALFFDGTAATIAESDRLVHVGLALVAYAAMRRATGSVALAFGTALLLGGRPAWFLLAPVFCLAVDPSFPKRPGRWVGVWILAAPIVVLAVPAQGALAIVSTAPLAAYAAYRWWRSGVPRLRSWPTMAVLALAVVSVATPVGQMLVGAARFLVEFGAVNQIAYAMPWQASLDPAVHPNFAAEVVRMSWIVVPAIAVALLAFFPRDAARRPQVIGVALPALLFFLALVPYTMGRITPAEISRPGIAAVLGWSVLVPLMVWAAFGARVIPMLVPIVALGAGALGAHATIAPLLHAGGARPLPGDTRAAIAAGLAPFGAGITDNAHRRRLVALKTALDTLSPPGTPYLDLTGRSAQHFYLERRPALRIVAPYNLAPIAEQRRAVGVLAAAPPSVALLAGDNFEFDGGPLSLRAPLLYRFVLDTYEPHERDGFVFGRLRAPGATGASRSEAELALLDRLYAAPDLHWIPVSWGRSLSTLAARMDAVASSLEDSPRTLHDLAHEGGTLRVMGGDPFASFDVSGRAIAPAHAGLLKFDFECTRPPPGTQPATAIPRIQLFFWGDAQEGPSERSSFRFNATNGTMIVPLDAFPRYLVLARLRGLRIDLDALDACQSIAIRNVGLYQRRGVADDGR
jgi:hypothetical protein